MTKKSDKNIWPVAIPLLAAVLVMCAFAVSGYITKTADKEKPTATTEVSAVNQSEEDQKQTASKTTGKTKVSLVAVGDNLIHNTLIASGEKQGGSRDYTQFYEHIKQHIEPADIAVINQETMLGGEAFDFAGYPMFNTPWEVGTAAIDAGFDVFTCATNHSMDVGSAGVEKELEFFNNHKSVVHIGTNASEEAYNAVTYYEKNNITFALLNYTYGTNGISLPKDKPWLINLMDKEKIKKDMTEARKNADVVLVFPHWGTENSHEISSYQEEYTKLFSDLGADIIIGTHPHVLQPVQWYENKSTGKKTLVYYSLGNFISHQTSLDQLCGGMAEITIEKDDGKIEITSARLAPVVCHYEKNGASYAFSVYKLSDYTKDLAAAHAQTGATVDYFTKLSEKIIDDSFLDL